MRWSSLFVPTGFLVSRRTFRIPSFNNISITGVSPSSPVFPKTFVYDTKDRVYQVPPISLVTTLGIVVTFFSSPYWDISIRVVSPSFRYNTSSMCWVFPFGFLRIIAYLQLPEAFRRSSRPSSPSSAKASTVRPFFLNLIFTYFSK